MSFTEHHLEHNNFVILFVMEALSFGLKQCHHKLVLSIISYLYTHVKVQEFYNQIILLARLGHRRNNLVL